MDLEAVEKFYDYFNHENPTEIRVFDKKYPAGKSIFVDDKNQFVRLVQKYQAEGVDVYVGGRDRVAKGDDNVVSSDFIFLEIDEHDITKPELKHKVENFLKNNGIEIGMSGFSGGGYHFYIPHQKENLADDNRESYKQNVLIAFKEALISQGIEIDGKIFNLERLSRILGSYNFKRNQQSTIITYNPDVNRIKNTKAILNLIKRYQHEIKKIDKTAVELLEKYKIDKTDKWLYDLVKKGIMIKEDTGGNSVVFKQTAIILTRENIPDEEIKIIAKAVADLCKGRTLSSLYGWIKKCKNNEIYENYILELNNFISDGNYDLTPYKLTNQEIKEIRDYNQQQQLKSKNLASKKVEPIYMKDFLRKVDSKENPIIKNYIPEKAITTFFGEPASMKSIIADYIACCVSTGTKFLNQYPIKKRPVLILSTENSERTDRKRLKAIFKGLKINSKRRKIENLQLLIVGRDLIEVLSNEKFYEQLIETIKEYKIELLIIDTISPMILDTNDNLAGEVGKTFKQYLFPLIDNFGIAFIIVMHSQKSGKDFLGSVKHKALVETFYEIKREDNDEISLLCHKNRDGEHNLKVRIDFLEKKERLEKINFGYIEEWKGKQSVKNKENNPAKLEQARQHILEILNEKELSYSEMVSDCLAIGITRNTSKRAINSLYESKEIRKKQGKTGGYYIS